MIFSFLELVFILIPISSQSPQRRIFEIFSVGLRLLAHRTHRQDLVLGGFEVTFLPLWTALAKGVHSNTYDSRF